jgi:hypothetical protein
MVLSRSPYVCGTHCALYGHWMGFSTFSNIGSLLILLTSLNQQLDQFIIQSSHVLK